jgi:hypothetical protein
MPFQPDEASYKALSSHEGGNGIATEEC